MSQFAQDQQIAAILGSGRPSPMRGVNQPLSEGGGPQIATTTSDNNTPTPAVNLPQASIAQAATPSPAVSPIAQATQQQGPSAQQQWQAQQTRQRAMFVNARLQGNQNNGYVGANGNFGTSFSGSVI